MEKEFNQKTAKLIYKNEVRCPEEETARKNASINFRCKKERRFTRRNN